MTTSPLTSEAAFGRQHRFGWLAAVVVGLAVLARCYGLSNVPGVNGDEGWYGVQAWSLAHGQAAPGWRTPTGNPINPLFLGPLALVHGWLPPSIALLRSVALISGLAALVLNWILCRRVFGRRTAVVSTALLAVLPINIAYSRFGWDASQSLAATLPVLYLSLAAIRFPDRFGVWIAGAMFAEAVAVWVHPTNVFVAPVIVFAVALHWASVRREAGGVRSAFMGLLRPVSLVLLGATVAAAIAWLWLATTGDGSLAQRLHQRAGQSAGGATLPLPILLARLFVGGTIYRDIVGSRSWLEWPLPADSEGWGVDVGIFWLTLAAAIWILWHFARRLLRGSAIDDGSEMRRFAQDDPTACDSTTDDSTAPTGSPVSLDVLLLCSWAATLLLFATVAGAEALLPGQERFAVCLVAPTTLLFARAGVLAWETSSTRWRPLLGAVALTGAVVLLADFHAHYFAAIQQSGGDAHYTFRTAATEPKEAALRWIMASRPGTKWIVCSQWWNYWPIRYLASAEARIRVLTADEATRSDEFRAARDAGVVWYVEFTGTREVQELVERLGSRGVERQEFLDFGRRPVLCVLHPGEKGTSKTLAGVRPAAESINSSPAAMKKGVFATNYELVLIRRNIRS